MGLRRERTWIRCLSINTHLIPKQSHKIVTRMKNGCSCRRGFIQTWNSRQVERLFTVAKVNLLSEQRGQFALLLNVILEVLPYLISG